jgi:hypothetical protein
MEEEFGYIEEEEIEFYIWRHAKHMQLSQEEIEELSGIIFDFLIKKNMIEEV